jgi:hypothetical protein
LKELSLRPYSGKLFVVKTAEQYKNAHKKLFKTPIGVLNREHSGRYTAQESEDGVWTYLVWGDSYPTVAHEIAHVVLHVFERCGIDPREGAGEPFCYMLSQLLLDWEYWSTKKCIRQKRIV